MIKVTLEFKGVDEAIVALGKLVGAPVAQKAAAEGIDKAPPTVTAAPTTRRPRADAGKKRGSYKNVEAPADADPKGHDITPTPAASTPETAAPPAPAEGDKPQPSGVTPAVAAAPTTEADAQKALEALFAKKGLAEAQRVLGLFGVAALRFLPADKRGEFITKAQEATNG